MLKGDQSLVLRKLKKKKEEKKKPKQQQKKQLPEKRMRIYFLLLSDYLLERQEGLLEMLWKMGTE